MGYPHRGIWIPPSLICSPTLSLTPTRPACQRKWCTHPQQILFHPMPSYLFFLWCIVVDPTQKMVDVKVWRRQREGKMRTWRKAVSIENSDTGIVCFYIQDTFQIAKFPWTTQNTQNEERNQRQHNNIIMPSSTLNQGLKEWDWIYERPGWEGFTVSSTYSFVCIINTLQWL